MKQNFKYSVSGLAIAVSATLAVAAPAAAEDLWTGGFVGLGGTMWTSTVPGFAHFEGQSGGYDDLWQGNFQSDWNYGEGTAGYFAGSGQTFFGEVGFDQQLGNFVLGGFIGIDTGEQSAGASISNYWASNGMGSIWNPDYCESNCGDSTMSGAIVLGDRTSLGARAGYLITPTTLLFGSVSQTTTTATLQVSETLENFFEGGDSLTNTVVMDGGPLTGTGLGFGVEQMFGNWSVKAEYRTTNYGEVGFAEGISEGDFYDGYIDTYGGAYVENLSVNEVRLSVNFRF